MPRADNTFIKNIFIPFIPLSEQTAIAAYLDAETAKIDALVAKKQTFIDLLKEKRQAVITQAVTKGIEELKPRNTRKERKEEGNNSSVSSVSSVRKKLKCLWYRKRLQFLGTNAIRS
jgi:restriction endonuclease S subunit